MPHSLGEHGGIVLQNLGNPMKWLFSHGTTNALFKTEKEYRIFIKRLLRKEKGMRY